MKNPSYAFSRNFPKHLEQSLDETGVTASDFENSPMHKYVVSLP